MPDSEHGEHLIGKASFIRHINNEPRFGSEPTFSMQLATAALAAAALDRQQHKDFEAQMREVERQRQKIERLHAEMNEKKQLAS